MLLRKRLPQQSSGSWCVQGGCSSCTEVDARILPSIPAGGLFTAWDRLSGERKWWDGGAELVATVQAPWSTWQSTLPAQCRYWELRRRFSGDQPCTSKPMTESPRMQPLINIQCAGQPGAALMLFVQYPCSSKSHAQAVQNQSPHQIAGCSCRALKTKGNTPKYGLIFHSSFIGRAKQRNKGRISRYLANKCSMASRCTFHPWPSLVPVYPRAL